MIEIKKIPRRNRLPKGSRLSKDQKSKHKVTICGKEKRRERQSGSQAPTRGHARRPTRRGQRRRGSRAAPKKKSRHTYRPVTVFYWRHSTSPGHIQLLPDFALSIELFSRSKAVLRLLANFLS